jgi:hypothetical protein
MPDQIPQHGNEEPEAPLRLIEALRRLPQPLLLVPPQIDAAALSRARLHLSHIREIQGPGQEPEAYRLALAARSGEEGPAPAGPLPSRPGAGLPPTPLAWWKVAWKILALAALLAAGLWLAREWREHGRIEPVKPQHNLAP